MKNHSKAMSGVVATALLLVVAVVAVISFQNFYNNYQSGLFVKAEQESGSGATGIETVVGNDLYFKNTLPEDIEIKSVKVSGVDCNIPLGTNATAKQIEKIDVSACVTSVTDPKTEVVVVTDKKVYSKFIYFSGASGQMSSATVGNMTVIFANSNTCSNASFVNIYDYYLTSNSHVTLPSQTNGSKALCVYNGNFNVNTNCLADSAKRLFYLGNVTNSHIWISNTTAYVPYAGYYNWQEVCIGSNDGTVNLVYNTSDMTGLGYSCMGSYLQDDTYGGVIGECGSHPNKIWVKIN